MGEDMATNIAKHDTMAASKMTQNAFITHHTFMYICVNNRKKTVNTEDMGRKRNTGDATHQCVHSSIRQNVTMWQNSEIQN